MLNPLQNAILDGKIEEVRRLAFEQPELLRIKTDTGTPISMLARRKGRISIFVTLVRVGAPGSESITNWAELLENYISEISDRACAGWLHSIEFVIWHTVQTGQLPDDPESWGLCGMSSADREDLAFLADRAQGWPTWSDEAHGVIHVSRETWLRKYEQWRSHGMPS